MDFSFTEQEKMLQGSAREFAQSRVKPQATEIDRSAEFPVELAKEMGKLGYYSLPFLTECGGSGAGYIGLTLVVEQICQVSLAVGAIAALGASIGGTLLQFGNEEQKRRFLIPLISGEMFCCWAFTEPATGSNPKAIATQAVPQGGDYLISGEKSFISFAPVASLAMVFAKDETGRVSTFLVDTSSPGFTVGKPHDLMGARGLGASPLYLNEVRVPKENLLGEKGKGYHLLLEGASMERLSVAIGSLGVAQAALELSIDYAQQRTAYERPIAQMPTIQWPLAEMASRLEASRWLVYRTAFLRDQSKSIQWETAVAKLFASQMAVDVTRMAMQIHGAYGTEKTLPVERLYRDAKMAEIIVGVSEIQRVIIAAQLLWPR